MSEHADGIYFGLNIDAYRDDPAIGSTDLKRYLGNPVQAQFKRLASLREDLGLGDDPDAEESAGKRFGSAVHTITLEGPETFEARYCVEPEKPADLLETKEDITNALSQLDLVSIMASLPEGSPPILLPKKSDKREVYIQTALAAGLGGRLLDTWKAQRDELMRGREPISQRWAATIRLIGKLLDTPREKYGGKSPRDLVLSNGYPEVSVFWTDEESGVRCKARFDYLRIKTTPDVKTYACREGEEPISAFCWAVVRYAYDLQAAHYQEARAQIGRLYALDAIFECHPTAPEPLDLHHKDGRRTFLKRCADVREPTWTWLAIQTFGMPEIDVLEFTSTTAFASAQVQRREALRKIVEHRRHFGDDQLWIADRGLIQVDDMLLESTGALRRMLDRGTEKWTDQ